MSDARLRDVRRAYDRGTASRLEWVSALARVQPERVALAGYLRDEDAIVAMGYPPREKRTKKCTLPDWAADLPRHVAAAGVPEAPVAARIGLCIAMVASEIRDARPCVQNGCRPGVHTAAQHDDRGPRAVRWIEQTIAGRGSWRQFMADQPGGLNFNWPDRVLWHAIHFALASAPGGDRATLWSLADEAVGRGRGVSPPPEVDRAAFVDRFNALATRDLGPWVLGERDPVRERLRKAVEAVPHGS